MVAKNGGTGQSRTVDAVATACAILDELHARGGAGVTELAEALDVSKSTVHAQLTTLRERELVVKDGDAYRLSLKFLDLGRHVENRLSIYDVAVEEVRRLAAETGEVAQLMTEEHGIGVYLHKEVGEDGVQTASYTGNREHLHCTALGKAILSEYDEGRIREIVERRGLPAKTENTITDRDALAAELERVRETGIAYDRGEILEGLRCMATPVTDADGTVLGAISVSGPVSRFDDDRRDQLEERLRHSANVVEINASRVRP
jgi:DNA-binding IclR family transcriptional regulator